MQESIKVQCVGCKEKRDLSFGEAAKGQPYCPKCGMPEVMVSVTIKPGRIPRRQPVPHPAGVGCTAKQAKEK